LKYKDVLNADNTGAIICEVLWNQELVLESVIQLIFLGLCAGLFSKVGVLHIKGGVTEFEK